MTKRYNFSPKDIWNVDETGIMTIQHLKKILAKIGTKQVRAVTLAERGTLVTMISAISATGNDIPPYFIFSRVHFKPIFLNGGPADCTRGATQNGWVNEKQFVSFLKNFYSHVRSLPENKILLILDNHGSHTFISTLNFCKTNGIVLLSIPPHYSHKLQPLCVRVFVPMKTYLNTVMSHWLSKNLGRTMLIYDLPVTVQDIYLTGFQEENILSSFRKTGISPFNPYIFTNVDFLPSYSTNRDINNQGYHRVTY
ncbi:hypothetical protein PGB90_003978 [Kerria lacca]